MPATLEPPAPAAPAASPGSKTSVAAKAAQTVINVSALPKAVEAAKPPKAGSARARLYDDMQKKFGGTAPEAATAPPPTAEPASAASPTAEEAVKPAGEAGEPATPAPAQPETPAAPSAETPAAGPAKKMSPWKLVDQFKERATKAEARVLELEKQVVPAEKVQETKAYLEQLEAKVKDMTEDLRYYNAEKYDPEIIKAKDEYMRGLTRAMSELKDVTVTDPGTNQPRALTINDLAELAFMPLGQAQQVAKEVFGELAPYVMDHRNEIRRLWDQQKAALEELKKGGSTREQKRMEEAQQQAQKLGQFINETYQTAIKEAIEDPKFGQWFKARDGDEDWNSRLEKGTKLVDEAMANSPLDPKLTPEQRAEIVRKHAAVRNRAIAFGPLRHRVETLEKQLAEALAELKQYKETTPTTGGRTAPAPAEKPRGMAGLMADLQRIAH